MGVKVSERPGKGWYVFTNCKGQRKAKFFGRDERLAREFGRKLEARLKWAELSGEPVALSQLEQKIPIVKDYLEDWLKIYARCIASPRRTPDMHAQFTRILSLRLAAAPFIFCAGKMSNCSSLS